MRKELKVAVSVVLILAIFGVLGIMMSGCSDSGRTDLGTVEKGYEQDSDTASKNRYNITIYTRDGVWLEDYVVNGWTNLTYSDGYIHFKADNKWYTYVGVMAKIESISP